MEYAQLNEELTEAIQVTTHGNVEWDKNHFCPASALTEDEAIQFRVVPLTVTEPPVFDPITQSVIRDGCEKVGNDWQYKWRIDDLSTEQIAANKKALVPVVVSKFQAKAALLDAGHLAAVEAIMSNPATPELMRLAWTEAQEFRSDSPTVAAMAAALGLSEEDVDNLFIYAIGVTA